jgi:hypothetical protein
MARGLRLAAALAALLLAPPLAAQDAPDERGLQLGLRYWYSSGKNQFSHDASGVDASLGDPTSILTYDKARAHAVELHGRAELRSGWFVRGSAGYGAADKGSFDDEDYAAGQVKFSDTTSSIRGDRLSYFSFEAGREVWRSGSSGVRVDLYAGFQQWSETLEAYGAEATVGPIDVPDRVLVITNDVRWRSLRAGLAARFRLGAATSFVADVAVIPYSEVRNEDSHHLRADLGPTPNVITTGEGGGVQVDLELRHAVTRSLDLGVGVRHWHLRSTDADVRLGGSPPLPVNEIETRRTGVTLSASRRW